MSIPARLAALERAISPIDGLQIWVRLGEPGQAIEKRSQTGFIVRTPTLPAWIPPGILLVDDKGKDYPPGVDMAAFRARLVKSLTPSQARIVSGARSLLVIDAAQRPDTEPAIDGIDLADPFMDEYTTALQADYEEREREYERELTEQIEARKNPEHPGYGCNSTWVRDEPTENYT